MIITKRLGNVNGDNSSESPGIEKPAAIVAASIQHAIDRSIELNMKNAQLTQFYIR
jgi:hypothetical protein